MLDVSVQWHHSCLWDIIGFQKIISESALFCFILFEQHDCLNKMNVEAFFFPLAEIQCLSAGRITCNSSFSA